jgi:sugar phosphate isomerase/epimerase
MTAGGLLDEASRLGVRVVQFCDNLPLAALAPAAQEALQERARRLGIAVEVGTRGLAPEPLRAHLALARRFGSPFLRLVLDGPGDEPTPEEAAARLLPMMPEFEAAGVRLAIENHDRFRSADLARLVGTLGRDRAGICLDTVNSFGALEGPEAVVEALGPLALCAHVKDFTVRRPDHRMGFVVEGCAAGCGRLDVPWLLRRLGEARPFSAILETWVTPGTTLGETIARERAWTEEGVRYLRGLISD